MPTQNQKDEFYDSWDWCQLRYAILSYYGYACMCCGCEPPDVHLQVDHIKALHTHWHLKFDADNLQVLCKECNRGKGARHTDDFREVPLTDDEIRIIEHHAGFRWSRLYEAWDAANDDDYEYDQTDWVESSV